MTGPSPTITVITVVYNGGNVLERTMQSVLSQAAGSFEYIVIDGGSKDGTLDVIKKYQERLSYWISEPDKGIYDAMNKGIDKARGQWTIFMNSGDRFASPDVLSGVDWSMDADIIYGNALKEYPGFTITFPTLPLESSWKDMPFCHNATFTATKLLKEWKFDLRYRFSADFDFIYRAWLAGKKIVRIPDLITLFDYKEGASINNGLISIRERRDSVLSRNGGIAKSSYFYILIFRYKLVSAVKNLIGKKVTAWLTRLLRTS